MVRRSTNRCPADLNIFLARANAKAVSGDIDPLQTLKQQKVYLFHGYNDAVVAKSVTDAAVAFYRHYLDDGNRGNLYQTALAAGHSLVVAQEPHVSGLNDCQDNKDPSLAEHDRPIAGAQTNHIVRLRLATGSTILKQTAQWAFKRRPIALRPRPQVCPVSGRADRLAASQCR
jgi:hypothetical protein